MPLLLGDDEAVAAYVALKLDRLPFQELYQAVGVIRRDRIVGGIVFHNLLDFNVDISLAFERPDWCFPSTLRDLFAIPFIDLNRIRITAVVARNNKPCRDLCKGLGFKEEGILRKGFDGRVDSVIYGMLRENCRWLRK